MTSSSPQHAQGAAKRASAAKPGRKAARSAARARSAKLPAPRHPAAKRASRAPAAGPLAVPGRGTGLAAIREAVRALSEQELVEVVGAVMSSQVHWKHLRLHVEGLLRAAQLAPVVEAALIGDVAPGAVALDRLEDDLVARARIAGEAKRALVTDDALLTAAQVSELLGSRSGNPRQYANRLRLAGELLAIPHANKYVYPAFQFDVRRKRVHPEIAMVGGLLGAAADPWGALSWWQTPNARIGDRKPRDLLGTPHARQLRALAEAVVEPVG